MFSMSSRKSSYINTFNMQNVNIFVEHYWNLDLIDTNWQNKHKSDVQKY